MTSTLDHYSRTAARYAEVNHASPAANPDRDAFLARLRAMSPSRTGPWRVLDAGSGSGRDTLAFLREGLVVDAFDGSEAMAALSSQMTGQTTQVMQFDTMVLPAGHYDGIWAMASLLHVPRADLGEVLTRLGEALRPGGILFASFKYGDTDRIDTRDGRAFTDLDEAAVARLVDEVPGWSVVTMATCTPPAEQTNAAPWFSVTLQREAALAPEPKPRRPGL